MLGLKLIHVSKRGYYKLTASVPESASTGADLSRSGVNWVIAMPTDAWITSAPVC